MSRLRATRPRSDDGIAMVTVLASMLVLSIVVTGALATAAATLPQARRSQDYVAAMAAAKAGVDDFMQRLSADTLYWQADGTDAANPALVDPRIPSTANRWRTVPGIRVAAGAPPDPARKDDVPQYQYSVLQDFATIRGFGLITLKAVGKVRNVQRTVQVDLRQESFLRFGYFTDFESLDPALYTAAGYNPLLAPRCAGHYYWSSASDPAGRATVPVDPTSGKACPEPSFRTGDVVNGPMHTNDALQLNGTPAFKSRQTESSWPTTGVGITPRGTTGSLYRQNPLGSRPSTCSGCYSPVYADPLQLPPVNNQLRDLADPARGGRGCLYTGPTQIQYQSSGGYKVLSPNTRQEDRLPAYCGSFPSGGGLRTTQSVSGPANGVLYVRTIPAPGAAFAPAYWSGFPDPQDDKAADAVFGTNPTNAGDAYVDGRVKGQFTLATDRNITITGDLTYQNALTGTDTLGLISTQGFVQIYHPVTACAGGSGCVNGFRNASSAPRDIKIQAAIMSVNHSFQLQNYNVGGPLGTVTFDGSLAQRYRGPVALSDGSTGFVKDYRYDTRLQNFPPPAYINPANAQWQVQKFSEQKSS